jgi:enoyl-CoA hydratase/carnithine racemase
VIPSCGGLFRSARALPLNIAKELLLTGDRLTATRCAELGLVNRVTAAGGALAEALALAERLNGKAPNALASIKELLNEAPVAPLTQQLASERDHFVRNLHHANGGIGIQAFLTKQKPRYS